MKSRNENGQAGAEILFFSVVMFSALTLVVINTWATIDAKFMVTAAAREATRSFVEAESASAATSAANAAAVRVIEGYGAKTNGQPPLSITGSFGRCQRVAIRSSYRIPALKIPFFGITIGTRTVGSTHSEIVDPYRSGISGEVDGECLGL
jgi:hypothetical protein